MALSSALSGSQVISGDNVSLTFPFSVNDTTITGYTPVQTYTLSPSQTGVSVDTCRLSVVKYIVIKTVDGKAVNVKLDALTEDQTYNPLAIITGNYTAVTLGNPSSSDTVAVQVQLAGTI